MVPIVQSGFGRNAQRSAGYEEIVFIDKAKRYYKKCIIHNDRLVGAILIGDKTEFLEFRNLIEEKMELTEKKIAIVAEQPKAEPVIGKLVCSCNNVGEGNLMNKIKEGCKDHLQLCQLNRCRYGLWQLPTGSESDIGKGIEDEPCDKGSGSGGFIINVALWTFNISISKGILWKMDCVVFLWWCA